MYLTEHTQLEPVQYLWNKVTLKCIQCFEMTSEQ